MVYYFRNNNRVVMSNKNAPGPWLTFPLIITFLNNNKEIIFYVSACCNFQAINSP